MTSASMPLHVNAATERGRFYSSTAIVTAVCVSSLPRSYAADVVVCTCKPHGLSGLAVVQGHATSLNCLRILTRNFPIPRVLVRMTILSACRPGNCCRIYATSALLRATLLFADLLANASATRTRQTTKWPVDDQ